MKSVSVGGLLLEGILLETGIVGIPNGSDCELGANDESKSLNPLIFADEEVETAKGSTGCDEFKLKELNFWFNSGTLVDWGGLKEVEGANVTDVVGAKSDMTGLGWKDWGISHESSSLGGIGCIGTGGGTKFVDNCGAAGGIAGGIEIGTLGGIAFGVTGAKSGKGGGEKDGIDGAITGGFGGWTTGVETTTKSSESVVLLVEDGAITGILGGILGGLGGIRGTGGAKDDGISGAATVGTGGGTLLGVVGDAIEGIGS